jgi:hypothetical protein
MSALNTPVADQTGEPKPGSYEARYPTLSQKRVATVAARAGLHNVTASGHRYGMKPPKGTRYGHGQDEAAARLPTWYSPHSATYTCPELGRNPGIPDSRFAAYTVPSRVGKRLHYPDGRIEEVTQP